MLSHRFIVEENVNDNTGIAFYAVFDGHGGEFAADFAKDVLVKNIYNKLIETNRLVNRNIKRKSAETPSSNERVNGRSGNNNIIRDPLPKRTEPLLVGPGSPGCRLGRSDSNKENYEPETEQSKTALLKRRENSLKENRYDDK